MPDAIDYDAANAPPHWSARATSRTCRPAVWAYEVSGKHVLRQWFSYRKKNRERPIIGDRRPPSTLGDIQPDHWLAEYTTELINVLHVLGRLVRAGAAAGGDARPGLLRADAGGDLGAG